MSILYIKKEVEERWGVIKQMQGGKVGKDGGGLSRAKGIGCECEYLVKSVRQYSSEFANYIILKYRMFQYTPAYQTEALNYAFLPHLPYQLCYVPSEQMCFMPPLLQNHYEFLPFNHVPSPYTHLPNPHIQIIQPDSFPTTHGEPKTPLNNSNQDFILQKNDVEIKGEPKQKFGRNICSNIFHLMVKFIKKQKKMKAVVTRIIQQNNMSIKLHEFYQIFKNRSYKLKAYANISKISQFWQGPLFAESEMNSKNQKEVQCSKIFRIVSKQYLTYHHLPYVYNSLKIKSESKRLHMESIRKILSL